MTLVCFALPFESVSFEKCVRPELAVRVVHTGMGSEKAVPRLKAAINQYRPSRIILSGFAGALHPDWRAGDLVIARNLSSGEWLERIGEVALAPGVRIGELFTAGEVIDSPRAKAGLRARTGADAVDMESAALHRAATDAGIPVLTVRSISDDAHSDLVVPAVLLAGAAEHGVAGTTRLIAWVLSHPSKWVDFSRFVRNSKRAQLALSRVAQFV
jgi:adenosylhomocysteine nucleosidase